MAVSISLVLIGFFNIIVSCMRKPLKGRRGEDEAEDTTESIQTEEIDSVDEEEAAYYESLKRRARQQQQKQKARRHKSAEEEEDEDGEERRRKKKKKQRA